MLSGINSIASKHYLRQSKANYFAIPDNNKQIFHILIHGLTVNGAKASVGINYDEYPNPDGLGTVKHYSIQDIGDLSFCDAYQTYASSNFTLNGAITFNQNAHFELLEQNETILSFHDGQLTKLI
jgi:hypothetical protein